MRLSLAATMFAWFFVYAGTDFRSPITTIGPFSTKQQCNEYREWVSKTRIGKISNCWQTVVR